MTPGRVHLKIVSDRLDLARRYLADLEALRAQGAEAFVGDRRNPAAAESFLRRAIEALSDAARHLLAKGHGLAGLEYRDVARLARERGLVTDAALAPRLIEIAGFRNRLTHYDDEVTADELFHVLESDCRTSRRLPASSRLPSRVWPEAPTPLKDNRPTPRPFGPC
jgi:uncharacterized protein YutE (UPF0331/DUF86 family)